MTGVGEHLAPLYPPQMPAVLVNPRVPVATRDVFAALGLRNGELLIGATDVVMEASPWPEQGGSIPPMVHDTEIIKEVSFESVHEGKVAQFHLQLRKAR